MIVKYLIEGNRESKNYNRDDYRTHTNQTRRNFANDVPHLLASQLDIV